MKSKHVARPYATVGTLAKYLEIVDQIWTDWTDEQGHISDIWFRGQGNCQWSLVPSALRPPYVSVSEHRYRHEFTLRAQPFLAEATVAPVSDWDWYFLMQHYGLPTRLLDWSESALVALYFAVTAETSTQGSPCCVWVLSPRAVNRLARIGNFIPIYNQDLVAPYLPAIWDERPNFVPLQPVAIDPPFNSPRLAAQRGKFTVHGRSARPLDSFRELNASLLRLDIEPGAAGRIVRQLLAAGITQSVLFPGLAGLSLELRDLYAIPLLV
jgi:hypothetical protein